MNWCFQNALALGTIHLRRRQILTIFDPYPPTIGIPAKCLWRGFLILMYCDLLIIGTWGHPSPPATCWRLKWMVPYAYLYIKPCLQIGSVLEYLFKWYFFTIRCFKTVLWPSLTICHPKFLKKPISTSYLMQIIKMAIQHGNSSCILETAMTPGSWMRFTTCNSYFNWKLIIHSWLFMYLALYFVQLYPDEL